MCGRAKLSSPPDDLRELFGLDQTPELEPRYNMAPTQPIPIVRERRPPDDAPGRGERRIHLVRWGLVPPNAPDLKAGARMINARVESLLSRGIFRDSLVRRRCLVAVDGYYEWLAEGPRSDRRSADPSRSDRKTAKRPFLVRMPDGKPFALAGLWDRWRGGAAGGAVDTCTIITTDSVPPVDAIHDRMPIVLPHEAWDEWLDPKVRDTTRLLVLLASPVRDVVLQEVGTRVNSAANDDPECAAPVSA